jgi:Carbamoylphosphate synthase large subunit (split gene in MJ)
MKEELEKNHNLPVIASGIRATEISTDKYQTKKFLTENKLKTPGYTEITRDKYKQGSLELDYPVVLKQSEGQGGVGVKISLSPGRYAKIPGTLPPGDGGRIHNGCRDIS